MPIKILGQIVDLPCGANVRADSKPYEWQGKKMIMFNVHDPNQSFGCDMDGEPKKYVEIAVSVRAIPSIVRYLAKVYRAASRAKASV